jgi:hypothetical protein
VNPDPLLRRVEPSVSALLQDVHARAAVAAPAARPGAVAVASGEERP